METEEIKNIKTKKTYSTTGSCYFVEDEVLKVAISYIDWEDTKTIDFVIWEDGNPIQDEFIFI